MKETVKCSRAIGMLEKMYRQLNEDKFGGTLETPVITIQSTSRAYGHVTCSKVWKKADGSESYELNIDAGTMNRPIESVVSTLLHEMVHIYHLQNGIKDTSRGCTYHNGKFRDKAVEVGLHMEHDKRIGWSITSPSDELILYICEQGWSDFMMGRNEGVSFRPVTGTGSGEGSPAPRVKKPSSTRKYACPCCGTSVRATKAVRIICADCAELMELCE